MNQIVIISRETTNQGKQNTTNIMYRFIVPIGCLEEGRVNICVWLGGRGKGTIGVSILCVTPNPKLRT